ncbi:chaperonin 10-like protein [Cercophora newfieldiana]|uniref:Chaperonin 10-like protein n=1 Tax=Cercophora newfieldiana TaxID=92897 RepID=A0AA39Y4Y1_9PEZI|nr:chaperonin 10-like protein [Cercophora newfieldiana]
MPAATEKTMRQYVATKKGGPFQVVNGPYPIPGPDEICIRNRAVALNALDLKSLHHGMMVQSYPEVFGIDTAGVVEVVGANVTEFKAGDAVMSSAGLGGRKGAFQDVTTVPAHFASRKPATWSFAQACSAPICYLTASAAITKGLNTPLPHLQPRKPLSLAREDSSSEYLQERHLRSKSLGGLALALANPPPPPPLNSILVVGGSSGVGASAIQLLRHALPGATIISTNSPSHNKRLAALGASVCVDRNQPMAKVLAAVKAASPAQRGVDAILDAVGAAGEDTQLFGTLNAEGPKLYTNVFTGKEIAAPEGVEATKVFAHMMFVTPDPEGASAMVRLADLVDEGKYKLPLEIEVVGTGLDEIGAGLEKLKKGVSGAKLVVAL